MHISEYLRRFGGRSFFFQKAGNDCRCVHTANLSHTKCICKYIHAIACKRIPQQRKGATKLDFSLFFSNFAHSFNMDDFDSTFYSRTTSLCRSCCCFFFFFFISFSTSSSSLLLLFLFYSLNSPCTFAFAACVHRQCVHVRLYVGYPIVFGCRALHFNLSSTVRIICTLLHTHLIHYMLRVCLRCDIS